MAQDKDGLQLLEDFISLLETEKDILTSNNSKELAVIVEQKQHFVDSLPTIDFSGVDRELVEEAVFRIRELQETNLLLTQQSMQFVDNVITAFNEGVKKSTKTYSKEGYHTGASQANLLNQSL